MSPRAGKSNREISEFNNIPMSTVKKHKKDYTDFIDVSNSPEDYDITRKSHKCTSNTHSYSIVARVKELVNTDPWKSMRAMAHELEVSATLFCKIVKEDLRYKSYGLRKGQFMSEVTKLRWLEKTKKLRSRLKHPPTRRFGPLAAQTATPSTIMSGASLNRMLIKPPKTLRSPLSQRSWRCSPTCPERRLPSPATGSEAAWRRSLGLTGILLNTFFLNY